MSADLELIAAEISGKTGQTLEKVQAALSAMTDAAPPTGCKQFGLNCTPKGRKRGRPPHPALVQLRELFPEWSERTIARYHHAYQLLISAGVGEDVRRNLVELYTRKNGSV